MHFNRATLITQEWRPEDVHYQLLAQQNVPREFVDDAVPEFILYWMERRKAEFSWGSKFVKHVLHAWRRHECEAAVADRTTRMTRDWQPNDLAIQQLRSEGVGDEIIRASLNDFILYWLERGDSFSTWSSKFVQFTRSNAARFEVPRLSQAQTRDKTLLDHLSDRSWANEE